MPSNRLIGKHLMGTLKRPSNSCLPPLSTDNLIKAILSVTKEYRLTPALDR